MGKNPQSDPTISPFLAYLLCLINSQMRHKPVTWGVWPKHNCDGKTASWPGPETRGRVERSCAGGPCRSSLSLPIGAFLMFSSVRSQIFIVASVSSCFPFRSLMEHILHAFVVCTLRCFYSVYSICHPRFSQQLSQGAECHHI